tara:strand:+ start:1039 stop:1698 length:660 start_codon:yes stop_codon:yes gene_type:complete
MNWFDLIIIIIFVASILLGMKIGLLRAVGLAISIYFGTFIAGQYSDNISVRLYEFDLSLSVIKSISVIIYILVLMICITSTYFAINKIKPLVGFVTLGVSSLIDKLGGMFLGLTFGIIASIIVVMGATRLTYTFDFATASDHVQKTIPQTITTKDTSSAVTNYLNEISQIQPSIESTLQNSRSVKLFLYLENESPIGIRHFIPDDFDFALQLLDANLDN